MSEQSKTKKPKVNFETAMSDVTRWLEHKRVKQRKIDANAEINEALAYAIMDGQLILRDDFHWELTLTWPIGQSVDKLIFKPRMSVFDTKQVNKGVKSDDTMGKIVAYVSALTNQPKGIIEKIEMGSDDHEIMTSIAVYFL